MKTIFFSALSFLLIVGGQTALTAAAQSNDADESIDYHWSFAAKVGSGSERKLVTISRDTAMHSGDELKMMVNLKKRSFVYVINKTSKNEISLLYPYTLDTPMEIEKNIYIPKGRSWFKLDKTTGDETFYILASQDRLVELENKLRHYAMADAAKKGELAAGIVNEIKDIKKKYRSYSTAAERPISIAGNVRGTKSGSVDIDRIDVATLATEIAANKFYSKTITIEHK